MHPVAVHLRKKGRGPAPPPEVAAGLLRATLLSITGTADHCTVLVDGESLAAIVYLADENHEEATKRCAAAVRESLAPSRHLAGWDLHE